MTFPLQIKIDGSEYSGLITPLPGCPDIAVMGLIGKQSAPAEPKPTPASGDDLNVYKEMADNYRNDVQAEPKREDQPLRDLLAVIHCDGGHHTEAVGLDQSIKDAQAAVCELKRELAMAKREPLTYEQMRAVLIAEARRIAEQAGEKDPDSLPVDEEMLAQVMLAGRAVERAHGIHE